MAYEYKIQASLTNYTQDLMCSMSVHYALQAGTTKSSRLQKQRSTSQQHILTQL
jgi:hypothetical protein